MEFLKLIFTKKNGYVIIILNYYTKNCWKKAKNGI